ncbi:conserved hypothetical protein [Pediculus humanus corporis]|uniref:Soluble interferon alpha/beta receptor OPG204 n=1 Tax=Pediculus humanus subsp. corporis TaxID=121224 RepID=E0VFV7_PEDHC|nr:uncharacterized protein Phum_PHUM168250 [Pediculus humanus corporis]EEB12263.1 conserved hypothetical protein [Pediculus humanus corporis]
MGKLHFSKENSDDEFGINNKFKSLHCCSHGYRSIEWFKDGQPYPWSTNVSTLIIHPESRNQTIYSQQLTFDDSGKYKCVVRNDTHVLQHEVQLEVSGPSISIGWPKTTYKPRDQKANHGDFARFYCEAFVVKRKQGRPWWKKRDHENFHKIEILKLASLLRNPLGKNNTKKSFIDNVSVVQENISREEKRVIGSYLSFTSVRPQDYGQYKCKVKNLEGQVVELSAWLKKKKKDENVDEDIPVYVTSSGKIPIAICEFYVIVLFLFFSAVASTITFLYFGSRFRLWSKRIFSSSLTNQEDKKDLLIIYNEKDVGNGLDNLLSTIKTNKNRYSCSFHPIRNRLEIGMDYNYFSLFWGLLVIMTPELTGGSLTPKTIYNTIQFLQKVHFTIVWFTKCK